MKNKKFDRKNAQYINNRIRAPKVLCINQDNENLGIIATSEALKLAFNSGLDLVQIAYNGNVPTCKILDYGKYKYDQSKKEKISAKKRRESQYKLKEIKLRPNTDINDIKVKANKIDNFLNEGHHVKITIMFRGREMAHQDIAKSRMDELMNFIVSDIRIIHPPKMEGKTMSATISMSVNNDHN